MNYINFKRYKFSTVSKNLNTLKTSFLKALKFLDIKRYDFKTINKILNITKLKNYFDPISLYKQLSLKKLYNHLNFKKLYNYFNYKKYNFFKIRKKIFFIKNSKISLYLTASAILTIFIYLVVPTFFNFDKTNLEQAICKGKNITCSINGKVNYSFYPTPRIKIKDLVIYNSSTKKNSFIEVENTAIKLSIKNLVIEEKQELKKIIFNNYKINIDLKNLKKYKNIFNKNINLIPIKFLKGEILLLDKNDYIATIYDSKLNFKLNKDLNKIKIKGKFLGDELYINLEKKVVENKASTNITLKMPDLNLITKAKFFNSQKESDVIIGDILIKKDKIKFTGIFDYKNNEITINKSNLRNIFWDGKLSGKITLLPFFDFNLDLNLNSINFTKLYSHFLALDEKKQKSIFKINKKINGKINLSAERIYSSYNLVKSFESRIEFSNGNILLEQFLINLGKLGAADILGTINNDEKFSNFKYESNIFIDNQKKFLSKFGVYNKKNIPSNLFISGNFDLKNTKGTFYEISNNEKLTTEDVNFVEQEFNDYMLEDGYKKLFYFPKFKEFIKSVTAKEN